MCRWLLECACWIKRLKGPRPLRVCILVHTSRILMRQYYIIRSKPEEFSAHFFDFWESQQQTHTFSTSQLWSWGSFDTSAFQSKMLSRPPKKQTAVSGLNIMKQKEIYEDSSNFKTMPKWNLAFIGYKISVSFFESDSGWINLHPSNSELCRVEWT